MIKIILKTNARKLFFREILPYIPANIINLIFKIRLKILQLTSILQKKVFKNFQVVNISFKTKIKFDTPDVLKDIILYKRLLNIHPENSLYSDELLIFRRELLTYVFQTKPSCLMKNIYLKKYIELYNQISRSLPKTLITDLKIINPDFKKLIYSIDPTNQEYIFKIIFFLYSINNYESLEKDLSLEKPFDHVFAEQIK